MYGQYKRIRNQHNGTFTGKGWGWGGTLIRPQATGELIAIFYKFK